MYYQNTKAQIRSNTERESKSNFQIVHVGVWLCCIGRVAVGVGLDYSFILQYLQLGVVSVGLSCGVGLFILPNCNFWRVKQKPIEEQKEELEGGLEDQPVERITGPESRVAGSLRRIPVVPVMEEAGSSSHPPSSSMEGGAGGEAVYPWLQCIMGCKVKETTEVILLSCFHVICSGECEVRFLEEVKPGLPLECRICHSIVERDQLSTKVIPQKEFLEKATPKQPELICYNCIHDRPANSYCEECPGLLCEQCSNLHPQTRATQRHVLQFDLGDEKAKQMEREIAKSSQCTTHEGERLSHMCRTCNKKICGKCLPQHIQHAVVDIGKEQEQLIAKLGVARLVMGRCDQALVEINKKREEILTKEWDLVMTDINERFAVMMSVLLRRHREIRGEAKLRFVKQLSILKLRVRCTEMTKSTTQQYVKTAEKLMKNMDEVASVNFLEHSDHFLQWLSTMEKQLTLDFDRFVDKGWHFQVDAFANIRAQKCLKEYCQVEYSYQPRIPKVTDGATKIVKAVSVHASPSAEGPDAGAVGNSSVDNANSGQLSPRGLAVESTSKAVATSPTADDKGGSRKDPPSSTSSSSHPIAVREESNSDMETIITVDQDAESHTPAEGSEEAANASTVERAEEFLELASCTVSSTPTPVSPTPAAGSDEAANASTVAGAEEIMEPASSTVPSTPTPESPKRGIGKRERKKKPLPPGFVDLDQCWEQLPKDAAGAAATTRLRRKSGSSKGGAGPSDAKMPRLQPEIGGDGPQEVTNDCNQASVDEEQTQGQESSDGYASEPGPSSRRQSLRIQRRTIVSPGPDPGQKRPEPNPTDNDEVDLGLPEAPKASLEEPPKFCHFPVQGQDILKVNHKDNNEDYCCICLDGGDETVCCDYCPKVFHLSCHIPVLDAVPNGAEKWRCNYDTTKKMMDEIISKYPEEEGSENRELVVSNKRHFILACKFLMECYKIPEIPTMRWKFPTGYLAKYGKVPYHLKYIKEKLCTGVPEHFGSVQDMLLAFKQMFIQAFAFYQKDKFRKHARSCFEKFLSLVGEYYPAHRDLFTSLEE